jgi:DNA polymerase V
MQELLRCALDALEQIFREGFDYRKVGVMLHSFSPVDQLTLRMFDDDKSERFRQVMVAVNKIDRGWGKDTFRFAVANPEWRWKTKFEQRSPRYTMRLQEVLTIL